MKTILNVYSLNLDYYNLEEKNFCGDMYFATQEAEDTLTLNEKELCETLINGINGDPETYYAEYLEDIGFYVMFESETEYDSEEDEDFSTMVGIKNNLKYGKVLNNKVIRIFPTTPKSVCDDFNFEKAVREEYGENIEFIYPKERSLA